MFNLRSLTGAKARKAAPGVVAALLLVTFPFYATSPYYLSLLIEVFIFAVFAVSYDILLGYTGILSFGHALFFGLGAYATGLLLLKAGVSWLPAAVLLVLLALVFSLLAGVLSLRVTGVYFAMVTMAFAEFFYILATKWDRLTGGSDGLPGVPVPAWLIDRVHFYYFALAFFAVLYLLAWRIIHSPFGRVLVAIRENETRAAMVGYNVFAYKLGAMVLAGVLAALAGAVYALFVNYVYPSLFGVDMTVNVLLMTIIGGSGTLYGPVLGAALVRLLGNVLSSYTRQWVLVFGIIYVFIVMFLPYGIVGTWRQRTGRASAKKRSGRAQTAQTPVNARKAAVAAGKDER